MAEGLKDGFTKIANPILESLMFADLTKREYKICLCVIRYGYGYNKEQSEIQNYQRVIAELTGLNEAVIKDTLNSLQDMNIIKVDKLNKTLSFNRHIEQWKLNKTLSLEIQELGKNLIKHKEKLNKTLSKTCQNIKLKPPEPTPDKAPRAPKERNKERKNPPDIKAVRGTQVKIKNLTNIQKVVEAYKKIKGFDKIPNWDKVQFSRFVRDAKKLLLLAEDNVELIERGMKSIGERLGGKDLEWNLSTIVRSFPEYLVGKQKEEIQWE